MSSLQPQQSPRKREHDLTHYDAVDRQRRNQFLVTREVAKRLGMSYWTLRELWLAGKGPRQRVLTERIKGSTVGDIEDYLETCIVS
jgi:predicted DNA-binding transcriptional regulator AlpA